MSTPRVLAFIDWYKPYFKAGGPVRSMVNLVEHLGTRVHFHIVTGDRDYTATSNEAQVPTDQWIPADNGGPSLRLVGADGYTRNWVDKNAMPWASALGSSYGDGSQITNSTASLVHTGKAPLRIVGGLEARNQVVALRNPLTARIAGSGADPQLQPYGEAVEVTGYAQQGGAGLYANSTGNTGCGVASPENMWGVQSSMVTSSSSIDMS